MFYGRSLVSNCLLHAKDIAHHDCIALQVVCPACAGPLHKRGSEYTKLEYLAHYANPSANCELRVRRIVMQELERQPTTSVPVGDSLQKFLAKFEQIILEQEPPELGPAIERMRNRPTYRACAHVLQDGMRSQINELVYDLVESERFAEVVSANQLQVMDYTLRYLVNVNSYRAFLFALSYGAVRNELHDYTLATFGRTQDVILAPTEHLFKQQKKRLNTRDALEEFYRQTVALVAISAWAFVASVCGG